MNIAQIEVLKSRINSFEEIISADKERSDALLESIGELGGILDEGQDKLRHSEEIFESIFNLNFDKHKFAGGILGLRSRIDQLYNSLEDIEPLAQSLMPMLQNVMKEMRFLDMFADTKSMLDEAQGLYLKLSLQSKTFKRNDFSKLYSNFQKLLVSLESVKGKVDTLNKTFMTLSKDAANLEGQGNSMITLKELNDRKKDLIDKSVNLSVKFDSLSKKIIDISKLEEPNLLFIGQSLHNYVSKMYELGFDSDYIVSYLSRYGVQTDLVKMTVSKVVQKK